MKMSFIVASTALSVAAAPAAGCSQDDEHTDGTAGPHGHDAAGAAGEAGAAGAPGDAGAAGEGGANAGGSSGAGGAAAGAGGAAAGLQAPVLQSVAPLGNALHVAWKNIQTDCDKIEVNRNKDAGAYAVAATLAGAATSLHDTGATPPSTYCYTIVCKRGAESSPASNEKCATP